VKFRRAPALVSYWRQGRLLAENYATGACAGLTPLAMAILDHAGGWATPEALARAVNSTPGAGFTRVLRALERATLIERQGSRAASTSLDVWGPWLPHAGVFHFGTKDQPYLTPRAAALAHRAQSRRVPCPPPTKSYPARRRIGLPSPREVRMPLDAALLERRTWRRFSRRPAALADIATVLGLTWGVQQHATDDEGNRIVLKTSPSGGATHPIEVYVAAFNVAGLPRGIYHYDAARHAVTRVRTVRAGFTPMRYLPRQPWVPRRGCAVPHDGRRRPRVVEVPDRAGLPRAADRRRAPHADLLSGRHGDWPRAVLLHGARRIAHRAGLWESMACPRSRSTPRGLERVASLGGHGEIFAAEPRSPRRRRRHSFGSPRDHGGIPLDRRGATEKTEDSTPLVPRGTRHRQLVKDPNASAP
jgi:hypothetical protein